MKFIKDYISKELYVDHVMEMAKLANEVYKDQNNIFNLTIGSLYNEDHTLATYKSFYDNYNKLDNIIKSKYSTSCHGNQSYIDNICNHLFKDIDFKLSYQAISTIGGSGAISLSIFNFLDYHDYILTPSIGWDTYRIIPQQFNINHLTYNLFKNDLFDLEDFIKQCDYIINKTNKLCVIINDPCHNPTGYSMSLDIWNSIISYFNSIDKNIPIILINDIAYIDYAFNQNTNKLYFELFNKLNDNILVSICYSCSKSFLIYGHRLGLNIICTKNKELLLDTYNVLVKSARTIWGNVSNGTMDAIGLLYNYSYDQYIKEKDYYIRILKERSANFISGLNKYHIKYYPYIEGFFVTLKIDNQQLDYIHNKLINNHIYAIKVNNGIRVALCSININQAIQLPFILSKIINTNI